MKIYHFCFLIVSMWWWCRVKIWEKINDNWHWLLDYRSYSCVNVQYLQINDAVGALVIFLRRKKEEEVVWKWNQLWVLKAPLCVCAKHSSLKLPVEKLQNKKKHFFFVAHFSSARLPFFFLGDKCRSRIMHLLTHGVLFLNFRHYRKLKIIKILIRENEWVFIEKWARNWTKIRF